MKHADNSMKIVSNIVQKYSNQKSLNGKMILVGLHATNATAVTLSCMSYLGAKVIYTPVAYSRKENYVEMIKGIEGVHYTDNEEELKSLMSIVDIIMEDSAYISKMLYSWKDVVFKKELFIIEQTKGGIQWLKNNIGSHKQRFPVIDASGKLKCNIENRRSTPESVLLYILLKTQVTLSGKNIIIYGYGNLGSGLAELCKMHKAKVSIIEPDPIKRVIAYKDGFDVSDLDTMNNILRNQDIIVMCTCNQQSSSISKYQIALMKDGAFIANGGSGTGEIDPQLLEPGVIKIAQGEVIVTNHDDNIICTVIKNGIVTKTITILASGHPINLRYGNGTSSEDIDFVFGSMVLAAIKTKPILEPKIYQLNDEIEREVAELFESKPKFKHPIHVKSTDMKIHKTSYGELHLSHELKDNMNNMDVIRAVFYPRKKTHGHWHFCTDELYMVEQGSAEVICWPFDKLELAEKKILSVGDYFGIPFGWFHQVEVTSDVNFICSVATAPQFDPNDKHYP